MANDFDQVQWISISEENHKQRIDNFLIAKLKGVPKSKIYKIVRKGEVRVNKKRIKPEYKLQIDDIVRIPPVKTENTTPNQINTKNLSYLEQTILYEDDRLMVVNKPSGIAVHGGSGLSFGLIEAFRALRQTNDYLELVHRLDRDTSGCIIIAKKRSALRHLHEQLRLNQMDKTYHALVMDKWPSNRTKVKARLSKNHLQSGERMVFADQEGKASETQFTLIKHFARASLVEAKPITGRTHQIRVHCQYAGHPIANDNKYGDETFSKYVKGLGCKRLFLHAKNISFLHPQTNKALSIDAEYDQSLVDVLKKIEHQRN